MMKSNDNSFDGNNIELPFPPTAAHAIFEMEVYARFMRHLRNVPTSRPEIRVLTTIQFVADMMNEEDADIAMVLVGLGLRAPRLAFPESFLELMDKSMMRQIHDPASCAPAMRELQGHWHSKGDDKFAAFRRCYPTLSEGLFTPA